MKLAEQIVAGQYEPGEPLVEAVVVIYQVRAAHIGLRAPWIAEDPARGDLIAQVEAPIARLVELAKTDSRSEEYIARAHRINQVLTGRVSNRRLRSMLEGLTLQAIRYTRLALATRERRRESSRSCKQAIRTGNGERAEKNRLGDFPRHPRHGDQTSQAEGA
ncbi:MAG: hypothetical protein GEV05_25710 [Betaproteobacteria bacterium]|nr:hypothetical protein [Betaproteobacteria bacterium]